MFRRKNTISLLVVAGFILVGTIIFFVLHERINDYTYIPKNFQRVQLPSSLHFVSKKWDNNQADDPEIQSDWSYLYDTSPNIASARLYESITSSLKKQSYVITGNFRVSYPNQKDFEARGKTLSFDVMIGFSQDTSMTGIPYPGTSVIIIARRTE